MALSVTIRVLDDIREDATSPPLQLSHMTPSDFVIPKSYGVEQTVAAILDRAKGRRIDLLTIICHGVGTLVHGDVEAATGKPVQFPGASRSTIQTAVCRVYGGYGLWLGKEMLTPANVSTFGQLRGWFTDKGLIQIHGCAAADTGPDTATLSGDGPKLMRTLAAVTGASVRAPIQLQRVNVDMLGIARAEYTGPTYLFTATGEKLETARN